MRKAGTYDTYAHHVVTAALFKTVLVLFTQNQRCDCKKIDRRNRPDNVRPLTTLRSLHIMQNPPAASPRTIRDDCGRAEAVRPELLQAKPRRGPRQPRGGREHAEEERPLSGRPEKDLEDGRCGEVKHRRRRRNIVFGWCAGARTKSTR